MSKETAQPRYRGRLKAVPNLSARNKFARLIWLTVWLLFFRFTPVQLHGWRCLVLRIFGAKIAGRAFVYPSSKIWAPWNLSMGEGSCLAADVDCYNVTLVSLGEAVTISQKSYLCTASHDFDDPNFTLLVGDIVVRNGAWVAADVFIGPGVTVGEHAVALARSVITRDIDPGVVVAGNPFTVLRKRRLKA